ncbi:MAG TPA: helix-turn-helix transcriptional regulator [Acidimicrobiales bacterium]|jgi:DNA-binding CsgD family transcriptional regulator|nr:helix-turn-helix transcriptional regulator [Acidimicrobiales bacterium]
MDDDRASADELIARGEAALAAGRWADAQAAFEAALTGGGPNAEADAAAAGLGLAAALWWQGENQASVDRATEAYARFRRAGDGFGAVRAAVWLAITYTANFANRPAASGWLRRADRLLADVPPGPAHGWVAIARGYRMADLVEATALTERALDLGRAAGDVDLELVALAQLGHIRVAGGDPEGGFALLDEAVAAALAGERSSLDTVVYTCCDMLDACDLALDVERAARWCAVADGFVERYGCPFLYAECRTLYGGVLVAAGRWDEAERELATALRITADACPGLHTRALVRLADLRLRQGRWDQVDRLLVQLDQHLQAEAETPLTRAALLLARGDAAGAGAVLTDRLDRLDRLVQHRRHVATALALLVDAQLATGDHAAAALTAARLTELGAGERAGALAATARGRVALATGDPTGAVAELEAAAAAWTRLDLPYEAAVGLLDLARAWGPTHPDLAVEHARRALATFEQLGAAEQADRAAAALRSLGVVARTGPKGVGLLTQREQEVLGLLGLGLTNPEIAGRLHVSRKTAAHHVSSILSKLQLRNRAEAAVAARAADDR